MLKNYVPFLKIFTLVWKVFFCSFVKKKVPFLSADFYEVSLFLLRGTFLKQKKVSFLRPFHKKIPNYFFIMFKKVPFSEKGTFFPG